MIPTKLSVHTLANITGIVVPMLVTLCAIPLYLSLIGTAQYGTLLLVVSLLAYFAAFDFGIGQAVNRSLASEDNRTENSLILWTGLGIGFAVSLVGSGILYFAARVLFQSVFIFTEQTRAEAMTTIPLLVFIVPIMSLTSILSGALQGKSLFIQSNIAQTVGFSSIQLLPLFAAALGYHTLMSLILFSTFGRVCWLLLLGIMVQHAIKPEFPKLSKKHALKLFNFGSWATVSGLTVPFLTVVDRVFIATLMGSASVAVSSIAFTINMRMYLFPSALSAALFPHFSKSESSSIRLTLEKGIRVLTGIQTPILVMIILFIHPFLDVWLGSAMSAKLSTLILILVIGVWINGPNYTPHTLLTASGRPDIFARIYLAELAPFLISLWYAITYFGLVGAMWVITIRYIFDAVLAFKLTHSTRLFIHNWLWTIPAIVVAYVGALGIGDATLYAVCCVLSLVLSVITVVKVVPKEVLNQVLPTAKRLLRMA